MQPKEALRRSGSGATADARAAASQWEQEWAEADAVDRAEAARATREPSRTGVVVLALLGVLAALLTGIFPLTPGFASSDAVAGAVAAAVTAAAAVAVVPAGDRLGRRLARGGGGDLLIFTAALGSAGAAAIHLAVAKMHFDEYALFGVFFVGSGIAQLVWPIWLLLRRWRPLLVLGALGNSAIVALWAVDRIWGLPLGPEHWEPEPVGFGDGVTAGFEALLVVCCVALLVRGRGGALRKGSVVALAIGTLALTTLSLLSVLGVGASVLTPTQ